MGMRHLVRNARYPNDPSIVTVEVTAHLANGDWEGVGLTLAEGGKAMATYFYVLMDVGGPPYVGRHARAQ
jgi:hypothetical protein